MLIRALRESETAYQLAIVGGASYSDEHAAYLRRLAGGDSRIRFLGFQSGEVLDELRTNAGAYVMPSRQEGLPLSLLEMLSYGMPVIASDIPAVHEVDGAVAEDRLTLVPPGDVAALRGAIDRLPWPGQAGNAGPAELAHLGRRGRAGGARLRVDRRPPRRIARATSHASYTRAGVVAGPDDPWLTSSGSAPD